MATNTGKICSGYGSAVNFVSLKPIEVPEAIVKGEKFIKWDEVSTY